MRGSVWGTCQCHAILCNRLEHTWVLVLMEGSRTNLLWIVVDWNLLPKPTPLGRNDGTTINLYARRVIMTLVIQLNNVHGHLAGQRLCVLIRHPHVLLRFWV